MTCQPSSSSDRLRRASNPFDRRLLALALFIGVVVIAVAGPGFAQIVTLPPGLAPGAGYRLIFVTSGVRNGASGSAADYDAFAASAANAVPGLAALGTTWKAVVETAAITAQDHTGTNPVVVGGVPTNPGVPFYRLDGQRVAHDNAYFWNMLFPLVPIAITELGGAAPITTRQPDGSTQPWVWTGVTAGPSKLGSAAPVAAWATGGPANAWLGIAISGNANAHPLYAVSGILHAPSFVPIDPAASMLSLLACVAVGARLALRSGGTRRPGFV